MCACFFSSFSDSWVISTFAIFHELKATKHIRDPCCHPAAETGSRFIQIVILWQSPPKSFTIKVNALKLFWPISVGTKLRPDEERDQNNKELGLEFAKLIMSYLRYSLWVGCLNLKKVLSKISEHYCDRQWER
jgi:hypothetical protein